MDKQQLSQIFENYLAGNWADVKCSLNYENPFQLICATALSAQCTDKRVNEITPNLFRAYPDAFALANADYDSVAAIVKSAGLYQTKAKNLISMAKALVERHGGEIPDTMEELTALAGVGRKTANVILGNIWHRPGVVVDTHVKRISNRLGLVNSDDPVKIERELEQLIDGENHCIWGHRCISFGREICTAKSPKCTICGVKDVCKYYASL
ncbi:endonuclease III [Seleniivibrio woodruffii]|uniref:endonuclease III n=1 Tax=Seleniivibrio woodruffii TaxID=1078050 RepID=UPI002409D529|nr:endonuclease III [Seleniivibrio woodruffii]